LLVINKSKSKTNLQENEFRDKATERKRKRERGAGVFLKCSRFKQRCFIQAKQKWWAEDKDNKQQGELMMKELLLPKAIRPQTVTATLKDTSR
jgi:hypothetical protein